MILVPEISGVGQKPNYTEYNRHPYLFKFVSDIIKSPDNILSFGCSIGEECRAIREIYYPDTKINIHGLDVRESNIEYAKKNTNKNLNIQFYNYKTFIPIEYDIIFAMNCLCHYKLGIDRWIKTVDNILDMVKKDGIFVFHNTTYDITKTKLKDRIDIVTIPESYNYLIDLKCTYKKTDVLRKVK